MEIPAATIRALTLLTRETFEALRKSDLVPSPDLTGLKLLHLRAAHERALRESYRGRAPFELIQNADDARADSATFVVCNDGLALGHNGNWFSVDNFRSLADGWSDKEPGECIGHKGLGFRSVLDVTPMPHVIRLSKNPAEEFAIKFAWSANDAFIQTVLKGNPDLRTQYQSWTRHGRSACPVMSIPAVTRLDALGGGVGAANVLRSRDELCMFWLPGRDASLPESAAEQLGVRPLLGDLGKTELLRFLDQEVTLVLPFLRHLQSVRVVYGGKQVAAVTLVETPRPDQSGRWSRICTVENTVSKTSRRFFQSGLRCHIPPKVRANVQTPMAAKNLPDIGVTLAVELKGDQLTPISQAPFYVYFPTEDPTGFGFIVHADFHVAPDRKHLMPGAFNEWVMREVCRFAANAFLSHLLELFPHRSVFETLAPQSLFSAGPLTAEFSEALKQRKAPFIPTLVGLLGRQKAALAPVSSEAHYCEKHLSSALPRVCPDRTAFMSASCDTAKARQFLQLADVVGIDNGRLVDLIEEAGNEPNLSMDWWIDAYHCLANDPVIARKERTVFQGRRLVPTSDGVAAIPKTGEGQLCLPPSRARKTTVPTVFRHVFTFVHEGLAVYLEDPTHATASWVRERFDISRFEASDLLPKAIRNVVGDLYSGSLKCSWADLVEMWRFTRALTSAVRLQYSTEVWEELGRLPVVMSGHNPEEQRDLLGFIAPAFLLYWPDELCPLQSWIVGLESLPRASKAFFDTVVGEEAQDDWLHFFSKVGISATPKLLAYRRAPGLQEVPLAPELKYNAEPYNGERQHDENLAALQALHRSLCWPTLVSEAAKCGHRTGRVLHSMDVIQGLADSAQKASSEHTSNDDSWFPRLQSLCMHTAANLAADHADDSGFCRSGGTHYVPIPKCIRLQSRVAKWLPGSRGPVSGDKAFLRQSANRIIAGPGVPVDLNDALLPFVVTDDLSLYVALRQSDVRVLESIKGTNPRTLLAALSLLGEVLSTTWGQREVIDVPARWRSVRGSIQEIYRTLNQDDSQESGAVKLLATRRGAGIEFSEAPFYYADPGSLREAFGSRLPLLDSDRSYPTLFKRIGITQLIPGETVDEDLSFGGRPRTHPALQAEIVHKLGPYLIATLCARSDSDVELALAKRRLHERFRISIVPTIQLGFALTADPAVKVEHLAERFYLQRKVEARRGAVEEAHFTLYIASSTHLTFGDLDADALGVRMASVLQDRPSAEFIAICARIAARFKEVKGDDFQMRQFLQNQLQVSIETQEEAAVATGAVVSGEGAPLDMPPPMVMQTEPSDIELDTVLGDQETQAVESISQLVKRIVQPSAKSASHVPGKSQEPDEGFQESTGAVTEEQAHRGRQGEEEIKRRLQLPGGWTGFVFEADVRSPGCGFDFMALREGRSVAIEVKTFVANGRVLFTGRELKEAASRRSDYYLIGLLDSGEPEHKWKTFIHRDPIVTLLRIGRFTFEPTLQLSAVDLFLTRSDTAH